MEPRNRCQGINFASLCSMAGRYDNHIPTRCLAPIDFLKIPARRAGIVTFFVVLVRQVTKAGGIDSWAPFKVYKFGRRLKFCEYLESKTTKVFVFRKLSHSNIIAQKLFTVCAGLRKCRVILSLHHHLLVQLKLKFIQHAGEFSSAITLWNFLGWLSILCLQILDILRNHAVDTAVGTGFLILQRSVGFNFKFRSVGVGSCKQTSCVWRTSRRLFPRWPSSQLTHSVYVF